MKKTISAIIVLALVLSIPLAGVCDYQRTPSSDIFRIAENRSFSFECPAKWNVKLFQKGVVASRNEDTDIPQILVFPIEIEGTADEETAAWKQEYMDTYKQRLADEPEPMEYKLSESGRKLSGVRVRISSEDGMETVTRIDLLEKLSGQYYRYSCAYISSTCKDGAYEDETTFFEFLHAVETMEIKEAL